MPLDPISVLALAQACAPGVAPTTLLAVARAESRLEPLAIGVNGPAGGRVGATTRAAAVTRARQLIAAGRDIDLGLAQINGRNLARVGLSLEAAFDPCRNLAAAARLLADGYRQGAARVGPGQPALRIALSLYNTGRPRAGFANGYVARVEAAATPRAAPRPPSAPEVRAPAAWDSFAVARRDRAGPAFVLSPAGALP